jgi:hypothetical protein
MKSFFVDKYGITGRGILVIIALLFTIVIGGITLGDYLSDGEIVWSYEQDQANAQQELVEVLKTQTAGCND